MGAGGQFWSNLWSKGTRSGIFISIGHTRNRNSSRAADVGCHAPQDAPLVQLRRDGPHAGEPLGPQAIHDGPQVRRTLLCVRPYCSHSLLRRFELCLVRPKGDTDNRSKQQRR